MLGHVLVAADGRTVQEVPLRLGRLIIGRTPDNDVQIDSRFISRHSIAVSGRCGMYMSALLPPSSRSITSPFRRVLSMISAASWSPILW